MKTQWSRSFAGALTVMGLSMACLATPALAQVTFYEGRNFDGRSFSTEKRVKDFDRFGFNDRASSAIVQGDRWEVCEDARFRGRCVVLRPGHYRSLEAMGLNNRVSSVRAINRQTYVDERRYAPPPIAQNDYRRGPDEQIFEAEVTSSHAVLGPPGQRCWVEHEQVVQQRQDNSLPGTVIGAVVGGILGHQIGGGHGKQLATAGGAVAGAVVGSSIGRNSGGQEVVTQEVQRCAATPPSSRPEYWEVTYTFRRQEHRIQMTTEPGDYVTVNGRGEPRV